MPRAMGSNACAVASPTTGSSTPSLAMGQAMADAY